MSELVVDIAGIRAAALKLAGRVVNTPLLESPLLNEQLGVRVLFKAECLQTTGSFKLRGATHKLLGLDTEQLRRGVVAYSSGNHAQGVAAAARASGISAKIVIPKDAPALKIANTRAYGAEVLLYDRYTESREAIGQAIAETEGRTLVPPYDDPAVIVGQGTVGLEVAETLAERGVQADALFCPCGGGGLMAGVATAMRALSPLTALYAVEPEGFDDTARSLVSGQRETNPVQGGSICDSIVTPQPGGITFPINQQHRVVGEVVSEAAVIAAMQWVFGYLKLVVEPGGVVGLAAVLAARQQLIGRTVVVILSGGNVDPEHFSAYLRSVRSE